MIAGINFAAQDSQTRDCPKGSVANMSLGGGKNTAVNDAVRSLTLIPSTSSNKTNQVAAAVAAGLFMGVAAGNNNRDASGFSPASEPSACTVGASDISDAKASFSNYGAGVDVFAPGVQILSTWSDGSTNSISGTSMATPHVVGLAAYLLAFENLSTDALCERIIELSLKGQVEGLPSGTPNLLAYNGAVVE